MVEAKIAELADSALRHFAATGADDTVRREFATLVARASGISEPQVREAEEARSPPWSGQDRGGPRALGCGSGLTAGLFGGLARGAGLGGGAAGAQLSAAGLQMGADEPLEQFQAAQLLDEHVLGDRVGLLGLRIASRWSSIRFVYTTSRAPRCSIASALPME